MENFNSTDTTGTVEWTGRSGERYALRPAVPADLHVAEGTICILTAMTEAGEAVVWSGTAQALIADASSRSLLRAALPRAAAAYFMPAPRDEIDLMTILWDLDSARRPAARNAA
ncbi:MAG TPA: hypothetical protein VMW31_01905 [Devosiaceae bacterium]|nr:hypothetical protein [Devosiaceae bacterium]